MKRFVSLLLSIAMLTTMLCGCGDRVHTVQTPAYAKECLQRSFDTDGTIRNLYCMTNPSYATSPAIGQDLIDALRLEDWVALEDDTQTAANDAMTTLFVDTDHKRFDTVCIKVGKTYGAITIFRKRYLFYWNEGLISFPVEDEVYYRLPQEREGDLFAVVDALAQQYVDTANGGNHPFDQLQK